MENTNVDRILVKKLIRLQMHYTYIPGLSCPHLGIVIKSDCELLFEFTGNMIITAINWSNNFHFNTKISRIYDRILVFGYHWNLIGTAKLLTTENIFSITYNFTKHPWILWPHPINFERHSCWKEVHTPSLSKKNWTKFFPTLLYINLLL